MNLPPQARKGKSVKEAWAGLAKWARAATILPGPGVRLARGDAGVSISFHAPRQVFRGAFPVTVSGKRASVGFGTLDGIEPTIGDKPASQGSDVPFRAASSDSEGRLWLVLRARIEGRKIAKGKDALTLAATADPRPHSGPDGTLSHPLAVLISPDPKKPGEGARLYQIEYFHLRLIFAGERPFILPAA